MEGKITITARQACAVESAALMNPDYDVYLLFTSPGLIKLENTESDRILKALLSYNNVHIQHLDYETYTKGTPVENLYKDGKVEASIYARSHASDVLRYLTLWKYGGIYLDLDVIVIKPLHELPPNYAGSESERNVAAGVLNFSPEGIGHKYAAMCLEDLQKNFRGKDWGYNGPGVITRTVIIYINVVHGKICLVSTLMSAVFSENEEPMSVKEEILEKDSADEDVGGLVDILSGRQLQAQDEVVFTSGRRLSTTETMNKMESDDNDNVTDSISFDSKDKIFSCR
ncbi:hypothetical protein FQA39_LY08942 [Lamprigera yunnana]|nr:hypothetical protein FQA39_LY08942 [Lamprigera yunnana]